MGSKAEIVVGLDLGTTKVACIVGEVTDQGVDIIGVGSAPSQGMARGAVVHIEAAADAIRRAVEEAELMADLDVREVVTGIAGSHIRGLNSHGIVAVKDREVRPEDVRRVIDRARTVAGSEDDGDSVIHVIPQEFVIDDQQGVRSPVGMNGCRLEARVHVVTAGRTASQNIRRACNEAGLHVKEMALQQLASAEAVLTPDERDMGVALVDIGGGTTDVAVFHRGAVVHTAVLSLGGNHLTVDVASGLRTPKDEAERLKHKYGCALTTLVAPDEEMEVPSVGGRPPRKRARQVLSEIIEARMEEILCLVRRDIEHAGFLDQLHSGIVLTGGSTMVRGLTELAEDIFELDVRQGSPMGFGGLCNLVDNPKYATGVGLVLQAALAMRPEVSDTLAPDFASVTGDHARPSESEGRWDRLRIWVSDLF